MPPLVGGQIWWANMELMPATRDLYIRQEVPQRVFSTVEGQNKQHLPSQDRGQRRMERLSRTDPGAHEYWPTVLRFVQFAMAGLSPDVSPD